MTIVDNKPDNPFFEPYEDNCYLWKDDYEYTDTFDFRFDDEPDIVGSIWVKRLFKFTDTKINDKFETKADKDYVDTELNQKVNKNEVISNVGESKATVIWTFDKSNEEPMGISMRFDEELNNHQKHIQILPS